MKVCKCDLCSFIDLHSQPTGLGRLDVFCLRALRTATFGESDLLAFVQFVKTTAVQC